MGELLDIKLELVRRGIKQRTLALHLGVSEPYLSDVLNSVKPISAELKHRIRSAIDILSNRTIHNEPGYGEME